MATLPWRAVSLVSVIFTFLVVSRWPTWTKRQFTTLFVGLWLLQGLAWGIWKVLLYPKFFSPLRGLPEPAGGGFFMGQFKRIAAEPTGIPMRDWVTNVPNEGLIRYTSLFNMERLLITSPKALSEVLVTRNYDFEKPSQFRNSIGRILGIGILLAEGEQHRLQRRNLMPAFAFRHIKDLYPVFWKKSREGVEAMTEEITKNASLHATSKDLEKALSETGKKTAVLEVGSWASRVTLDIIGVAGLGRDFGAIKDPNNELNQTYQSLFKPSKQAQILGIMSLLLPNWVITHLPVKRNNDINLAARTIRSVCNDIILEKKQRLARKEPTDPDITSIALESGGFTDENLVNQLMTFLAAGHETTASAMTWAVYMLCRHPEIQTKLRKEIRENLPSMSSDRDVTSLEIDHLPYLNAVCSEVLRYYSPVPLTTRESVIDTSIQGHFVPKGVRIILCPWATNLDKKLWGSDADEFKPERWIAKDGDEQTKATASGGASSNYAFMSFLHGPRSCIGQSFAKAEFACLLASWIGRFEFRLRDEEEMDEEKMLIKGSVTARPAKGLYVYATVVERW
ncbi:cytochrome P450 97B3 [Pseudomassariella vexata]|uniref:Cytochrome P450 97B3 n=1 Tax=Pseudomassariella vexata TaxID=1141098 RepID=A0A1Y2E464_9PEZI|nr:cytochrome P450 97B3 [Pseudomassariella vexata]ORY66350.1 cytochrome P450 97B3 [Pseudomassariella vexata]